MIESAQPHCPGPPNSHNNSAIGTNPPPQPPPHRMWRGQAGGWTRVWRRVAEACAHVRRRAADVWKPVPYSPCAFLAPHHHLQTPRWCARAPWLRDRAPRRVAMAVAMAHHSHGLCLAGAGGGWARVGRGLAKWKAHVWRRAVCRTLGPSLMRRYQ